MIVKNSFNMMTLRLFFIISLIAFSAFSVGKSNAQEESEADVEDASPSNN